MTVYERIVHEDTCTYHAVRIIQRIIAMGPIQNVNLCNGSLDALNDDLDEDDFKRR